MPRRVCVVVDPAFQKLAMSADILIAAAYFAIPVMLWMLYRKRPQLIPSTSALFGFATFIVLCGTTHAIQAILWEVPCYRFWILVEILTAIASLGVAAMLPFVWNVIKRLRSKREYHELADVANQERLRAECLQHKAEERNRRLAAEFEIFKVEIRQLMWSEKTKAKAEMLSSQLERIIAANDIGVA